MGKAVHFKLTTKDTKEHEADTTFSVLCGFSRLYRLRRQTGSMQAFHPATTMPNVCSIAIPKKTKRVVFFARYEASHFGASYIETEHVLLGLLREDKALLHQFPNLLRAEDIRQAIENHTSVREFVPTSTDMPLSNETKRTFSYAAEEAERLSHRHIGTEHLLLGLLREEHCFAAVLLRERGITLEKVRERIEEDIQIAQTGNVVGQTGVAPASGAILGGWQRPAPPILEFYYAEGGPVVGSTRMVPVPSVGDELVIFGREARVTRVVHHYDPTSAPGQLTLKKIAVYLQPLK